MLSVKYCVDLNHISDFFNAVAPGITLNSNRSPKFYIVDLSDLSCHSQYYRTLGFGLIVVHPKQLFIKVD